MKALVRILVAASAVAAVVVGVSAAATPAGPSAANMTVGVADVAGAKVLSQGTVSSGSYLSAYQRTLALSRPYGRSLIVLVRSQSMLAQTPDEVGVDFGQVQTVLKLKAGRAGFAHGVALGAHVKDAAVKLGALRHPHVGDVAVEQPLSIQMKHGKVYESALFMRFDRTFLELVVGARRPVALSDVVTLAKVMQAHATQQLTPVELTAPVVMGTADVGQTLTVTPGTYTNTDVSHGYQWQRCDATGANCVAIAGATSSTYVVSTDDAGSTLDVVETATDRFAAPTATSAATTPVPVPAPPPAPAP